MCIRDRANTEEYDGTSWTGGGNLNTTRNGANGTGTLTAGLVASGTGPASALSLTEEYNGTAWTESGDMNTARRQTSASGSQTAALYAGGSPGQLDNCENYDGTSWKTTASITTARGYLAGLGGAGSSTSALVFGGSTPSVTAATEEFTAESTALNLKTLTDS